MKLRSLKRLKLKLLKQLKPKPVAREVPPPLPAAAMHLYTFPLMYIKVQPTRKAANRAAPLTSERANSCILLLLTQYGSYTRFLETASLVSAIA